MQNIGNAIIDIPIPTDEKGAADQRGNITGRLTS